MKTDVVDEERLDPKIWKIVGVILLGPFMTQMDSTVVNVSLSSIRDSLHSSIGEAQWIISGYLLALALMLPSNGYLVGKFGARRLYLACFSAFTLTSLLCGAARTMDELIAARVLQGIAGGLLAPMTSMMIAKLAGKFMARVIGFAAVPVLFAPIMGPVIAGSILKYASWRWLFYINLPVGILAVVLAAVMLPHDHDQEKPKGFDGLGFALISPGLIALLYGLDGLAHNEGALFVVIGLLLLALFLAHALRSKEKSLIDLSLFKSRSFTAGTVTQFLANGVIYTGQFLVPLYLVTGCGLSPSKAGFILAPMGIGMLIAFPCVGLLVERFGNRAVAVSGILVNSLGTLPFIYMLSAGFSEPLAIAGLLLRGLGQGATGIPSSSASFSAVPREKLANGSTTINIVQRLGGPVFTTLLAILISKIAPGSNANPDASVFMMPFIAVTVLQLTVLIPAWRLPVASIKKAPAKGA